MEKKNYDWERKVEVSPSLVFWFHSQLSVLFYLAISPPAFMWCTLFFFLQTLTAQIGQLLEAQRAERSRSKEEAQQWQNEKVSQLCVPFSEVERTLVVIFEQNN